MLHNGFLWFDNVNGTHTFQNYLAGIDAISTLPVSAKEPWVYGSINLTNVPGNPENIMTK